MNAIDHLSRFIVVKEGFDLSVFRSHDDALESVEAEDALSGSFTFAAGDGAALTPVRDESSRTGWRLERLADRRIDIRSALLEYLQGIDSVAARALERSTNELLELVVDLQCHRRA